jgi:cytochrome c-type biogenesis protein CcmE
MAAASAEYPHQVRRRSRRHFQHKAFQQSQLPSFAQFTMLNSHSVTVDTCLIYVSPYFYSPMDVAVKHIPQGVSFNTGGLVKAKSLKRGPGVDVAFVVTDGKAEIPLRYRGVLPGLIREGQGVVALGKLTPDGIFLADIVYAKHDEKYMPPEVVDALKRSGHWKEGE